MLSVTLAYDAETRRLAVSSQTLAGTTADQHSCTIAVTGIPDEFRSFDRWLVIDVNVPLASDRCTIVYPKAPLDSNDAYLVEHAILERCTGGVMPLSLLIESSDGAYAESSVNEVSLDVAKVTDGMDYTGDGLQVECEILPHKGIAGGYAPLDGEARLPRANLSRIYWSDILEKPAVLEGYTFTQSYPANIWKVDHNLGYKPSVTVLDTGYSVVLTDVKHLNDNSLTVTVNPAMAGYVILR